MILQAKPLKNLIVFVAAAVETDRRVVSQSSAIVTCFLVDALDEGCIRGIISARKHEILPDKYSKLVTNVVE